MTATATTLDDTAGGLAGLLARGGVRSVYQPIVELSSRSVVAYEALARGPKGMWERPDTLFAAARAEGRLAELDRACREAAFAGAREHGLVAPLTLFVNVEPEVLDSAPLVDLLALAEVASGDLQVVLEITERALSERPADLLRTVARVRDLGWGVALDDVGADSLSLAFMALLRPDVVKLDLRLVQDRPGPAVAQIMNAVNAYAEREGARILAEGIETPEHLLMAEALGATLGQGWLFGRPEEHPAPRPTARRLALPAAPAPVARDMSPFACLPPDTVLRRSTKRLLIELSKQLEREALNVGETCVIAAAFQHVKHFTPSTERRYTGLAERVGFVCALGEGMDTVPAPGVRGAVLDHEDPLRTEWDVVVVAPHFAVALLAKDIGADGPDQDRCFDYALTYDRDVVVRAANTLLARVVPRLPEQGASGATAEALLTAAEPEPLAATPTAVGESLLRRALAATTTGVTIADVRQPDQPLIYVNKAFETLSGFRADEVLGRNCRFLQSASTDAAAVRRMRAAIDSGREVRETLLNVKADGSTWWNEVWLAPVFDDDGEVVQYIGVQNDISDRVEAEHALTRERLRAQSYLESIEQLAYLDPLTGLSNRRGVEMALELALAGDADDSEGLAVLFLDLDGFKAVNDVHGHAVGDQLLVQVAARLRKQVRGGDLLARLGGDEFLIVLPGVPAGIAAQAARTRGASLAEAIAQPYLCGDQPIRISVSVGVAVHPEDGRDFRSLVQSADLRMYDHKPARL